MPSANTADPNLKNGDMMLEARHITKSHPGAHSPVLYDTSLSVAEGEFIAVVGRSGSGKSTLLNVLASLSLPDSGHVLYEGEDITTATEARRNALRHRDFAVIFQQHHLMPYLSALENVLLPFMAGLTPIPAPLRDKGRDVLARVGLSGRADALPGQLSGGEQQRVAIARALVRDARILFADEPTGSLDSATGDDVMQLLQTLNGGGLTIVMVTHNAEYASLAHRTLHMADGCLRPA